MPNLLPPQYPEEPTKELTHWNITWMDGETLAITATDYHTIDDAFIFIWETGSVTVPIRNIRHVFYTKR